MQVISTFTLDPDEAAYKLIFEIPSPIGAHSSPLFTFSTPSLLHTLPRIA
jgi:hypothetical protein